MDLTLLGDCLTSLFETTTPSNYSDPPPLDLRDPSNRSVLQFGQTHPTTLQ